MEFDERMYMLFYFIFIRIRRPFHFSFPVNQHFRFKHLLCVRVSGLDSFMERIDFTLILAT